MDLSRFELPTLRLSGVHSNQLSYRSQAEKGYKIIELISIEYFSRMLSSSRRYKYILQLND